MSEHKEWVGDGPVAKIHQQQDQLDAARFTYERVCFTRYCEWILTGKLAKECLNDEMAKTMENYDGIIETAGKGTYGDVHAKTREADHDYLAEFDEAIGK